VNNKERKARAKVMVAMFRHDGAARIGDTVRLVHVCKGKCQIDSFYSNRTGVVTHEHGLMMLLVKFPVLSPHHPDPKTLDSRENMRFLHAHPPVGGWKSRTPTTYTIHRKCLRLIDVGDNYA